MKPIIIWTIRVVIVILVAVPVFAQGLGGYTPASVTVSAGEDPLSSGIMGLINLTNKDERLLQIAVQNEQAWVVWGPQFKFARVTGTVAGSVGHMQGAPWVGPYLTLNMPLGKVLGQPVSIGTMQWPCVFFGQEPKNWRSVNDHRPDNTEPLWLGYMATVDLGVGPVGFSYSKLNFLDDPWNTILSVSYTYSASENASVRGSVTRDFPGGKADLGRWMYYIGFTWKFKE
jgi:hypothetical protein